MTPEWMRSFGKSIFLFCHSESGASALNAVWAKIWMEMQNFIKMSKLHCAEWKLMPFGNLNRSNVKWKIALTLRRNEVNWSKNWLRTKHIHIMNAVDLTVSIHWQQMNVFERRWQKEDAWWNWFDSMDQMHLSKDGFVHSLMRSVLYSFERQPIQN